MNTANITEQTRYTLVRDTPEHEAKRIADFQADFEERMRQAEADNKTCDAAAAEAYGRLVSMAETRDSGQIERIAAFLACTFNPSTYKLDISDLRVLDRSIRADMITVLQGQHGGAPYPYNLISDGEARVSKIIEKFGITPTSN